MLNQTETTSNRPPNMMYINRIGPSQPLSRSRGGERLAYQQGLYEMGSHTYAWIEPNGGIGESNAGLVIGGKESLLIDTLWDTQYSGHMLVTMGMLTTTAPIKQLVVTHGEGSHCFGNQLVSAPAVTSRRSWQQMQSLSPKKLQRLKGLAKLYRWLGRFSERYGVFGRYVGDMLAPYDFSEVRLQSPSYIFSGMLTVTLEQRPIHLVEMVQAHSQSDVIVFVPDASVLYAGDLVTVGVTPVLRGGQAENWLHALDRILSFEPEIVVPGHGSITDRHGVQQMVAYWEFMADAVGERYRVGMAADEAAADVLSSAEFQETAFAEWRLPELLLPSVYEMYRDFDGKKEPAGWREQLDILQKQAILADKLAAA